MTNPVYYEDDESREPVSSTFDLDEALRGLRVKSDMTPILPLPTVEEAAARLGVSIKEYEEYLSKITAEFDPEPDTYAIVPLLCGWWGLLNLRTNTVVTKIHGSGAREDITERWNAKTAVWLAWKARQSE